MPGMKQAGLRIYRWFEDRLGLGKPIIDAAEHDVPASTASWWYVFGSAATVLLVLQVVTGVLLGLVYSPSAGQAWASLEFLDHSVRLGWFLRALHGWGSDFMIAIVLIHLAQVFLFGAYKFPRELTWIVGVFLLLLTLGMAFTGQVLRFDQDAYWGLGIGASILSRVPWIGGSLVNLMLGGPIIAGPTLTRFFALHVFIIPGVLLALVGLHLWMVLRLGINEWPMPGRIVSKTTYARDYQKLTKDTGIAFVPDAAWKDAIFAAAILLAVMACALYFGPFGPTGPTRPNDHPDGPQTRLRISLDICCSRLSPSEPRNSGSVHCTGSDCRSHAAVAAAFKPGGEALVAPASRGVDGRSHRGYAWHLYPSGHLYPVEPHHGRMDIRPHSNRVP